MSHNDTQELTHKCNNVHFPFSSPPKSSFIIIVGRFDSNKILMPVSNDPAIREKNSARAYLRCRVHFFMGPLSARVVTIFELLVKLSVTFIRRAKSRRKIRQLKANFSVLRIVNWTASWNYSLKGKWEITPADANSHDNISESCIVLTFKCHA